MGNSARLPVTALVLASALWGVATSGTKYALGGFGPLTLLAVELVVASAALWTVLLVRGYRPPSSWRLVATLGLLEPALAYASQTLGLDRTSAANGSLILGLESAFVVVLAAIFLHEHIRRSLALAVGAATVGLVVLEGGTSLGHFRVGDALVLAGTLSAAIYTIFARAIDGNDSLTLTAHQFAFATVAIVPIAAGAWVTGAEPAPVQVAPRFWVAAALVGVAGYALSFVLYNYAIAWIQAATAGAIINLIPAFGLASAIGWLGESLTAGRMIGAGLITVSVAIVSWAEVRQPAADRRTDVAEAASLTLR